MSRILSDGRREHLPDPRALMRVGILKQERAKRVKSCPRTHPCAQLQVVPKAKGRRDG